MCDVFVCSEENGNGCTFLSSFVEICPSTKNSINTTSFPQWSVSMSLARSWFICPKQSGVVKIYITLTELWLPRNQIQWKKNHFPKHAFHPVVHTPYLLIRSQHDIDDIDRIKNDDHKIVTGIGKALKK